MKLCLRTESEIVCNRQEPIAYKLLRKEYSKRIRPFRARKHGRMSHQAGTTGSPDAVPK